MKNDAIKYLNSLITDDSTKKEIDLVGFIKKCVREYQEPEKEPKVDWLEFFERLWKTYPRRVNKELAKRTFEHKIRGLSEQECRDKCNNIYKAIVVADTRWKSLGTEMQYIPHFSSWLNASVPNSPKYKGR